MKQQSPCRHETTMLVHRNIEQRGAATARLNSQSKELALAMQPTTVQPNERTTELGFLTLQRPPLLSFPCGLSYVHAGQWLLNSI